MEEQTLVLVKPDGVKRGLIGEIIARFERIGLSMVGCKMVMVPKEMAAKHYGYDDQWFINVGRKTLEFYEKIGKDPNEEVGTKDPKEIGKLVQSWNIESLTEGPVLAMVWHGPHAVEIVRKVVGPTYPELAPPGTIRGDFGFDSPATSNSEKRSVRNLIHASGTPDEAKLEIELWFKEEEIVG